MTMRLNHKIMRYQHMSKINKNRKRVLNYRNKKNCPILINFSIKNYKKYRRKSKALKLKILIKKNKNNKT